MILLFAHTEATSGIIQNAAEETVKLVVDLVSHHIAGNCIILVTVPMSGMFHFSSAVALIHAFLAVDDIDNQKALQMAERADPNGIRTIGACCDIESWTIS